MRGLLGQGEIDLYIKRIVPILILITCAVPYTRLEAQDGFRRTPPSRSTAVRFSGDENRSSDLAVPVSKPITGERFANLESAQSGGRSTKTEPSSLAVGHIDFDTAAGTATDTSFEGRLIALEKYLEAGLADEGIDVSEEKFSYKVGGRFFLDSIYGTSDDLELTNNRANFSNQAYRFDALRLHVVGKGYGIFDYKIQLDFKDFNDPTAKDVYLGADFPIGRVRAGHFKEPFGLEELTSARYITFMERSLVNAMVPARNIGMELRNQWGEGGNGTWAVGTFIDDRQNIVSFDDDGQTRADDNASRAVTARLTYLPYYCAEGR